MGTTSGAAGAPGRPGDSNPGHLLQHRGGRAIAHKKRQAHARVAHCNGCLTGAVTSAPSVGEPAHHPLDRMGFYGFGQTLKLAICEKYHNPKNSKNACTGTTPANDCGVMSTVAGVLVPSFVVIWWGMHILILKSAG